MKKNHIVEGVFNSKLGELIKDWGIPQAKVFSEASQSGKNRQGKNASFVFDISIEFENRCTIVIESEKKQDKPGKDAKARLGLVTSHGDEIKVAIGLELPDEFNHWNSPEDVTNYFENGGCVRICIQYLDSGGGGSPKRWPESGLISVNFSELVQRIILSAAFFVDTEELSKEIANSIKLAAKDLKEGLAKLETTQKEKVESEILDCLHHKDPDHGLQVATCLWLNCLLMQDCLAEKFKTIPTLNGLHVKKQITARHIKSAWEEVLKINYNSIFKPADKTLHPRLPPENTATALKRLFESVSKIQSARINSLISIGSNLYPRIAAERKESAAFYTLPETAEFLACMILPSKNNHFINNQTDCYNQIKIKAIQCFDPACGTGTLLRATYRRICHLYKTEGGNPKKIHQAFIARQLTGIDISPIAIHLTATAIASLAPEITYNETNIGVATVFEGKTGSFELLDKSDQIKNDMFDDNDVTSSGKEDSTPNLILKDKSQDLCIMNPPYSRTRGGQASFDIRGLDESGRKASQKRYTKLIRKTSANGQAGFSSAFTVLATQKLKQGGMLGSVLPLTAASAESWQDIRKMLATEYDLITSITYSLEKETSFSADTGMQEMLLVAHKKESNKTKSSTLVQISLTHKIDTMLCAHDLAEAVHKAIGEYKVNDIKEGRVTVGNTTVGNWLALPTPPDGSPWYACGIKSTELVKFGLGIHGGYFSYSYENINEKLSLPIITLDELFNVGPSHDSIGHLAGKDPRGAFTFYDYDNTGIASLWKSDATTQTKMIAEPTHSGTEYNSDKAVKICNKQASCFLQRGMRWTSQKLCATATNDNVLGGSAWTALCSKDEWDEEKRKQVESAFLLWMNSSFGLLLYYLHGQKQQAGRSRMQIQGLKLLPVPDFSHTSKEADKIRKKSSKAFHKIKEKTFKKANDINCTTRNELDMLVIDCLGLPDNTKSVIQKIRQKFCEEPHIQGR